MKLHPDTVRELRRYYSRGYSIASLMEAYDLSRSCINGVVKYKTHRRITDDDALPPLVKIERKPVKRRPNEAKPIPPPQPGGAKRLLDRQKAHDHYRRTGSWPPWWDEIRGIVKPAPTHLCPCGFEGSSTESVLAHMREKHPTAVSQTQGADKRCPVCREAGLQVVGTFEKVMAHIRENHPEESAEDPSVETAHPAAS